MLIKIKMQEQKEDFCGACVAGLGVLLGAGGTAYSASDRKKHKKRSKVIFYVSLTVIIISILLTIYFLIYCGDCK